MATVALIAATVVMLWPQDKKRTSAAIKSPSATGQHGECAEAGLVSVPPGTADAWRAVVAGYARSSGKNCLPVGITEATPTGTGSAVTISYSVADSGTAVASSQVMLGMNSAAAAALQITPDTVPSAATLQKLFTAGWAAFGQPRWGTPDLVVSSPDSTTSGMPALVELDRATYGTTPTAIDYAQPTVADQALLAALKAASTPATSDLAMFDGVSMPGRIYVGTAQAFRYSKATALNLTTVPLTTRSIGLRALMIGGAQPDAASRANQAFVAYLTSPAGQSALKGAGFGPASAATTESTTTTSDLSFLWSLTHRDVTALALFDVSGSMADPLAGTTTPKVTLLRSAISTMLTAVSPQAVTALRYFHSARNHSPLITDETYAANNAPEDGTTHAQAQIAAANAVPITGGTPLYLAVQQGYQYAVANYRPGTPNNLLILTDGKDEDNNTRMTLGELTAELSKLKDPAKPIRVRCIALGSDADTTALQAIAAATDGSVLPLQNPGQLSNVVTGLFG